LNARYTEALKQQRTLPASSKGSLPDSIREEARRAGCELLLTIIR